MQRFLGLFRLFQTVDFVQRRDRGDVPGSNLIQRLLDGLELIERIGMRNIDQVQQQIGLADFLQRSVEGRHQSSGQFLNEPDCIGE